MPETVRVLNRSEQAVADTLLERAVATVLAQHSQLENAGLTVVIVDAAESRELNRRHRQIDKPTDVLSFAAPELPAAISQEAPYLGDIIIAIDVVAAQADQRGVDLADALALLAIHGALHLLGYRHDCAESCDEMWAAQARALDCLGIDSAIVSRYETPSLA